MDEQLQADLVALRRDLHRHPEIRFEEHRTSRIVGDRLRALGMEVREGVAGTGLIGSVGDGSGGRHIVLRADMDALPVADLKGVEYASQHEGVAHACGHDVHCAVVLGAAELLIRRGVVPADGRLSVLMQPAEEIPFGAVSGAQAMLDDGVFGDHEPDALLGLHCWPQLAAGTIGLDATTAMAAKLAFKITVRGASAHAATPHLGADALLGASQLVIALHLLLSREIDPGDRATVNVGTIRSGASQSIVAPTAELSGTVRSVDQAVAARLKAGIERTAEAIATAYRLEASVDWRNEMPPVRNDSRLVELAYGTLGQCGGIREVSVIRDPPMTADDFALYAARWPALYMKLGVAEPGAESWPSLHDGSFDVAEDCISTGVEALASVAARVFEHDVDADGQVTGCTAATTSGLSP